jgi:hypothetical protein
MNGDSTDGVKRLRCHGADDRSEWYARRELPLEMDDIFADWPT